MSALAESSYKLPEQDLMSYYTVVPEMSHKDSELQVLITNGSFTWGEVSPKKRLQTIMPVTKYQEDSPTGSHTSLITDSQNDNNFEEEVVLPTIRNINMQISKVN
ncbi:hypothetical protein SK128_012614 [Halocaridina rubra]|uniref:Uncharacterized protein n=1 Tax=Halocaridina rubra TaxID=373956 RepID=A0AAN8X0X4_HALRR